MGGRVKGKVEVARGRRGIGDRTPLSLRCAIHGGVEHGETARMIDGILRRCGHAMGTSPTSDHSHRKALGIPLLALTSAPRRLVGAMHMDLYKEFYATVHRWRTAHSARQRHPTTNWRTRSVKSDPIGRSISQ